MGRYSNLFSTDEERRCWLRLFGAVRGWSERSDSEPAVPFRIAQRLSDEQISQLAAQYKAGVSGWHLAER